jgi:hypothetical protein
MSVLHPIVAGANSPAVVDLGGPAALNGRTTTQGDGPMPSTFQITHRRMKESPDGTHQHVGWVKLQSGTELSRKDVFAWMKNGNKFQTLAPNGDSAAVIRVHCRRCEKDYLRTDRDTSKADNLDELPTF